MSFVRRKHDTSTASQAAIGASFLHVRSRSIAVAAGALQHASVVLHK